MIRTVFIPLLAATILLTVSTATAFTIDPTVSVNVTKLNVDQRNRVEELQEMLTDYLENWDDPVGDDYDMEIPLTMQITMESSSPKGTVYYYQAVFMISDQAEHQYEDGKWEFLLAEYEEIGRTSGYHSFSSFIDFYVQIMISHQIDKLVNFGGEAWLEAALRISQEAKFDQNTYGWYEREQLIESLMAEERELKRTLSWAYHTALYFYEVLESNYEAWNAATLCVDILEELPNNEARVRFINFAYFKLGNILVEGKDPEFLDRMLRMDSTHEEYYNRLLDSMQ
ncbi:MAG: DUF4835 family protein [Candidatus Delongbacteria bacterium]|nr:DUF4835 family protein [bacterium]MBL7033181.1 DUF4835 family protein [Candidatus Delongbacteria bacterium]